MATGNLGPQPDGSGQGSPSASSPGIGGDEPLALTYPSMIAFGTRWRDLEGACFALLGSWVATTGTDAARIFLHIASRAHGEAALGWEAVLPPLSSGVPWPEAGSISADPFWADPFWDSLSALPYALESHYVPEGDLERLVAYVEVVLDGMEHALSHASRLRDPLSGVGMANLCTIRLAALRESSSRGRDLIARLGREAPRPDPSRLEGIRALAVRSGPFLDGGP